MTVKHTPGPWSVDQYDAEPRIRTDGGMVIVPRVWGSAADAKLIAAAPSLLAACKAALANTACPHTAEKLRIAIAHAEGPPPACPSAAAPA